MKNLIIRDIRVFGTFFSIIFGVMMIYTALNLWSGSIDGIISFQVVLLPVIFTIVLFISDNELLPVTASMPVERKDIVLSKYASTFILVTSVLLITVFTVIVLGFFYENAKKDIMNLFSLRGIIFIFAPSVFVTTFTYPFLFKYGFSLGVKILAGLLVTLNAISMIVVEGIIERTILLRRRGFFQVIMEYLDYIEVDKNLTWIYVLCLAAFTILIFTSIKFSIRWFTRKDL